MRISWHAIAPRFACAVRTRAARTMTAMARGQGVERALTDRSTAARRRGRGRGVRPSRGSGGRDWRSLCVRATIRIVQTWRCVRPAPHSQLSTVVRSTCRGRKRTAGHPVDQLISLSTAHHSYTTQINACRLGSPTTQTRNTAQGEVSYGAISRDKEAQRATRCAADRPAPLQQSCD